MPRGGRREGAGRKPGSKLTKSQLIAAEVRDAGISPLELQLTTMRELWRRACESGEMDASLAVQACAIARDCAPYVHPRLASIEHAGIGAAPPSGPVSVNIRFVTAKPEAPTIDIEPHAISPEAAKSEDQLELARTVPQAALDWTVEETALPMGSAPSTSFGAGRFQRPLLPRPILPAVGQVVDRPQRRMQDSRGLSGRR